MSFKQLSRLLNGLGLTGICIALLIAFYYQLVLFDLPCPLCLLQRVGFILIGLGFLFNLQFGVRNLHYTLGIIGAIFTLVVSVRQTLLHIAPGDLGYGSTFLGFHFYTLAAAASVVAILYYAVVIGVSQPIQAKEPLSLYYKCVIWLFILLIAANLISTLLECGTGQCAENPVSYYLLGYF